MMGKEIWLVDDDDLMRRSLSFNLQNAGYKVQTAPSAEAALDWIPHNAPDLILLDINLPGMDGMDALRHVKQRIKVPVIFLTTRRRELDEVLGLEVGADDYITKPFNQDVLLARIKSILRRSEHAVTRTKERKLLQVGNLEIDPDARTVLLDKQPVDLPPRAFDLLYVLAEEAGRVVPLEDLLLRIWGEEYTGESQVVYVHIRWLREKLEQDPSSPLFIQTVRGVGYKLVPPT